jgi:hypothetical protein
MSDKSDAFELDVAMAAYRAGIISAQVLRERGMGILDDADAAAEALFGMIEPSTVQALADTGNDLAAHFLKREAHQRQDRIELQLHD